MDRGDVPSAKAPPDALSAIVSTSFNVPFLNCAYRQSPALEGNRRLARMRSGQRGGGIVNPLFMNERLFQASIFGCIKRPRDDTIAPSWNTTIAHSIHNPARPRRAAPALPSRSGRSSARQAGAALRPASCIRLLDKKAEFASSMPRSREFGAIAARFRARREYRVGCRPLGGFQVSRSHDMFILLRTTRRSVAALLHQIERNIDDHVLLTPDIAPFGRARCQNVACVAAIKSVAAPRRCRRKLE